MLQPSTATHGEILSRPTSFNISGVRSSTRNDSDPKPSKTPTTHPPTPSKIPRPQRLTDRTHPARHPPPSLLRLLRQQRLLQRALRHARVVQIAETAAHARRALAALFPRDASLPRRERRHRLLLLLFRRRRRHVGWGFRRIARVLMVVVVARGFLGLGLGGGGGGVEGGLGR